MRYDHTVLKTNLAVLQRQQTDAEMALQIGAKSAATWRARRKHPGTLSIDELYMLANRYRLSPETLLFKDMLNK